jgi:elongation factor G
MPAYTTEAIRNIALAGHAGAGKTSLFEALLAAGGTIQAPGSVERGTTLSDFDPMEKARGHSINSALASIDHGGIHLNLIDTPGYPDFRGPTLSALAAVETVAVVVNAATGIEHSVLRMMDYARARRLARMIVINKIDHEDIDLAALVAELRDTFGPECLPVNLPTAGRDGVIDCFANTSGDSLLGPVADWHQQIIDQVVEINEDMMGHYLEEGEAALSGQELHDAFEQCLREQHLVPICFVSARSGAGVTELLDVFERLMPNPFEANPPPFVKGQGDDAEEVIAEPDPGKHVIADVFKIMNDPFVGKLGVFRVYQGTVRRDSQLFIDDGKKPFKVGHLFKLRGKEHVEIEDAIPGDIAGVAKIEEIHFDAVLHDSHDEDQIHLKPLDFPLPMFGLAIEPAHKGQEQKLANALHRMHEEDPCFRIEHNKELNESVIRGLGELHLKLMLERMRDRYGVEVLSRPPRIAYRETVSARADGHHRHKKQTGGAGQFGEVFLRVEPRRLRVRRRGARRHHPEPVHPGGREGRATGAGRRRGGRLHAAGRPRHRVRRQVPPGRLEGGRLRRRRQEGLPRCGVEGTAAGARAGGEPRCRSPRNGNGRHHRRTGLEARADQRHRFDPRRRDRGQGAGAAGRTRRLRQRTEGGDRRPGPLHDRVQPLRAGSAAGAEAADRRLQAARRGRLNAARPLAKW